MTTGQVTDGATKMGLKVVNPSKRTLQRKAKAAAAKAKILEWKVKKGGGVVLTADGKDVGAVAQVGDMTAAAKLATDKLLGRAHPVKKQPSERTLRYHRQKARIAAAAVAAVQEARAVDKAIEVDLNFGLVTSGPETRITGGGFDFSHQMVDPDVLALNSLTETLGARGVMQLIRRSVA